MLTIKNIERGYLNNKPVTFFHVYAFRGATCELDYGTHVDGHWHRAKTVAKKHVESNGRIFDAKCWEV